MIWQHSIVFPWLKWRNYAHNVNPSFHDGYLWPFARENSQLWYERQNEELQLHELASPSSFSSTTETKMRKKILRMNLEKTLIYVMMLTCHNYQKITKTDLFSFIWWIFIKVAFMAFCSSWMLAHYSLGVHYFFIRKCSIGKKSFCSNRVIFHMARTNIFPIYCTVSNTFCLDFNQWHTLINVSCKTASN